MDVYARRSELIFEKEENTFVVGRHARDRSFQPRLGDLSKGVGIG